MPRFKKGDRVEMLSNLSKEITKNDPPYIGTVISVDGSYILVRPRYKRWFQEFYPNELKLC